MFWVPLDSAGPAGPPPSQKADAQPLEAAQPSVPPAPALTGESQATAARIAALRADMAALEVESARAMADAAAQLVQLNDAIMLQQVGIYEYHHPLENADAYRARIDAIQERIKASIKAGQAVLASDMFSYNNSLALGRRMTGDFSKLMLRAYNSEADSAVRSLRAGNLATAVQRLEASATTIARLGSMMEMRISPDYQHLRVEELELTADYLMKVQEEREVAREERERLREERKAEEELARERERLEKERAHYLNAMQALRDQGQVVDPDLEQRLQAIDAAIEQNDYRAANIRAGYVYVISNIGAMGARVVKIGMTRRLDPHDRIRELGDASVPFSFDVHVIHFSDDAVRLEGELHDAFADRRLNQVNARKEFFFATPSEVREVLARKVGSLLEFVNEPDATQYHQSRGSWPPGAVRPDDPSSSSGE